MKETDIEPATEAEFQTAVRLLLRPVKNRKVKDENRKPTRDQLNQRFRLLIQDE